jgi:hypothetical protein
MLAFFEVTPASGTFCCALASGDEELVREVWVHSAPTVRSQRMGMWLAAAGLLRFDVAFRWLLGQATETQVDEAVETIADRCCAEAICTVEAAGFDLGRMRPARALARWANAKIPVVSPGSGLPPSTFAAWHVEILSGWGIPTVDARPLGSGRVEWAGPLHRIDLGPLKDAAGLIMIFQTVSGVVTGVFTPCQNPGGDYVPDSTLTTAMFVLEHPSGEQRLWRSRGPLNAFVPDPTFVSFDDAVVVMSSGHLGCRARPSMGLTTEDARFVCSGGIERAGHCMAGVLRWEYWRVQP